MIARRTLLTGTVLAAAAAPAAGALAQGWGAPPTPWAAGPGMPEWPPRETVPLWTGGFPGGEDAAPAANLTMNGPEDRRELWIRGVAQPGFGVFRPERPNGVGILCLPGGGYEFLSVQNEGINIARRFTPLGYTVFVLTYRLPGEGWRARSDVALQDAQRAMRLIRATPEHFGVSADHLGVLGFSAGGHLAALLSTAHDERVYEPVDTADALSARPDFQGLLYPVVRMDPRGHGGSTLNLLGPEAAEDLVARRSPIGRIAATTPGAFLAHSTDDGAANASNSLDYAAALAQAGVAAELHLFDSGGHGYGAAETGDSPAALWPILFAAWLRRLYPAPAA